ncbi:MAG TPA: hypothetical protein VMV40_07325 [Acidiferrobacter sp.]|nr:hypothetical protein [Acidiferrobacter sp.]
MKKIALVAVCALTLGGCAHMSPQGGAVSQSAVAQQTLKQADMAVKKARADGALWLHVPHELALAHKDAAQGHNAEAIKAANEVIAKCRVAEQQAASNAHNSPYYH